MGEPMAPETPLSKSDRFQSDERVSHGMRAPANPIGGPSEAESYGRQDVDEAFDMLMVFPEDDDDTGDPMAASSAMEATLVAAGTHKDAAQLLFNQNHRQYWCHYLHANAWSEHYCFRGQSDSPIAQLRWTQGL